MRSPPPEPAAPPRGILHILTGPTAVGKTELALRWSETHGAEIISCDSLLFYRGMDIGTAKPTHAELARVPHHLIDCCDVSKIMDITRYVALARAAVESIASRGRAILVTGGSGFYLKSFFAPVADDVAVPPALRETLSQRLAADGLPSLVGELLRLNPAGLGALDTANPRRVQRALERCIASGRTLRELAADFAQQPSPFADFTVRLTCLQRDPDELKTRIAQRVDAMLAVGLIDEVHTLRAAGLEQNPSAAKAIGYRETLDHLDGKLSRESLAATIAQNTRALVKKQLTWFRTQLPTEHRRISARATSVAELFSNPRC